MTKSSFASVLFVTGLVGLIASAPCFGSQGAAARITGLSGKVEFQRVAEPTRVWHPATVGLELGPGDFLRTGEDGTATVRGADGTMIFIRPATLLEIPESQGRPGGRSNPSDEQDAPERPGGVSKERWVSLGTGVGIVLRGPSPLGGSTLEGTLWLKKGASWVRVHLTAPAEDPRQVVPAR